MLVVTQKETQVPVGMESDAVDPSGRSEGGPGPGRTRKKPKDLSACESEDRGEAGGVYERDQLKEAVFFFLLRFLFFPHVFGMLSVGHW
jgi:hypothetical protein